MVPEEIRQLIDAGNFKDALQLLDRHLDEHPSDKDLQFEKAQVLFQLEEFEQASDIINDITEFGSPHAYWDLKARTCAKLSQFQAASDCYDEMIGMRAKPEYFFQQGNMKLELDQLDEALACYDRALDTDRENLGFLRAKHGVLEKLSRNAECEIIKNAIRFLEMDPQARPDSQIPLELKQAGRRLERNPKNPDLASAKVFLLLRLGKLQSAINCIREFGHANPSTRNFSALRDILSGRIRHMQNRLAAISERLENGPDNGSLTAQKITLLADLEMYDDLGSFLRGMFQDVQDPRPGLLKLLNRFSTAQDFGGQLAVLERLIELEPTSWKYLTRQIYALNELGRSDEALEVIWSMLERNPRDEKLLKMKQHTLYLARPTEKALAVIGKMLEKNPDDEKLSRTKIFILNGLGRHSEALSVIDGLLEADPADANLPKSRIFALNSLGRHSEALRMIDMLLEADPEDEKMQRTRASTLDSLGRHSEALSVLDRLLEANPDDEKLSKSKIFTLDKLGRHSEALSVIDRLLEANPDDARLLNSKASMLDSLGEFSTSLAILEDLLGAHPDDCTLLGHKVFVLEKLSRYQESASLLEHMFDRYPDASFKFTRFFARILHSKLPKPDNHAFIDSKLQQSNNGPIWLSVKCKLCFLEGKYRQVLGILEKNKELPLNPNLQRDLAFCYEFTEDLDKAISLYASMLEQNPADEFSLFGRSQAYLKKREYDLALKDLQRVYSISPSRRYKMSMAFILGVTGRYDEAMDALKTASDAGRDPRDILKLKAVIHRKNRNFEPSMKCYEELLAEDPHDIDGLMGSALVYEATERYDMALCQLDQILEQGFVLAAMKLRALILTKKDDFAHARDALDAIIRETSDSQAGDQGGRPLDPDDAVESMMDDFRKP